MRELLQVDLSAPRMTWKTSAAQRRLTYLRVSCQLLLISGRVLRPLKSYLALSALILRDILGAILARTGPPEVWVTDGDHRVTTNRQWET